MTTASTIDFIGIGAARSGSTWLAESLRQHPQIRLPRQEEGDGELGFHNNKDKKELDFFLQPTEKSYAQGRISNFDKGMDWYIAQFPEAAEGIRRGEISPSYAIDPTAAGLIRRHLPDAKIIVMLRNPVDLVFSIFSLRNNSLAAGSGMGFRESVNQGLFLEYGRHYTNLKRYFDLFPREHIFVRTFEDMKSDPEKLVAETYRFLEIDDGFRPNTLDRRINALVQTKSVALKSAAQGSLALLNKTGLGGLAKRISSSGTLWQVYRRLNIGRNTGQAKPGMEPDVRAILTAEFAEEVAGLEKLLGRNLSVWRS